MKLLAAILVFITVSANATNYYVSNAGNDANNGTSTGTSWQTISKVNAFSFASGDSVLFKCGDIWNEKLIIPISNLKFGSYGTGAQPLITGLQNITGFTNVSGNVWEVSTGILHRAINTVTINGLYAYKARYPNSTFFTYKQALGGTGLVTYLTGDTSYVGAEIVNRPQQIVLNISVVTSQNIDTLHYLPATLRDPVGQWGFFFQNQQRFIDSIGEYSFDSTTGILSVYSVGTPTVRISVIDTLVLVNHKDNVTFKNIAFIGANEYTIQLDTSHNFSIRKSTIDTAGNYGIYASKCRDAIIDSNTIQNCYNISIVLGNEFTGVFNIKLDTCKRPKITNNTIRKSGIIAGMANRNIYQTVSDGESSHTAIFCAADSAYIENNRIDSTGYEVIRWTGYRDTIMHNYITNWCFY
jgi:hypothetical protein